MHLFFSFGIHNFVYKPMRPLHVTEAQFYLQIIKYFWCFYWLISKEKYCDCSRIKIHVVRVRIRAKVRGRGRGRDSS